MKILSALRQKSTADNKKASQQTTPKQTKGIDIKSQS
jgi:methionyl aminopeptidase